MLRIAKAIFSISLFIFLQVGVAFAAGDGHHAGLGTLFWPAINFALYLWVLVWGFKKIGRPALVQQNADVTENLARSASEIADANALLEVAKARIENIDSEKTALIARIEQEGENTSSTIIQKARTAAVSSKEDVARRIVGETSRN